MDETSAGRAGSRRPGATDGRVRAAVGGLFILLGTASVAATIRRIVADR